MSKPAFFKHDIRASNDPAIPPVPALYVHNNREREIFLRALRKEALVDISGDIPNNPEVSLKLKALEFITANPAVMRPEQCFVAMWFDPSMNRFFDEIVKPACTEVGYEAVRVSDKEFTGDITDEIIAGIRESAFVIADFTGQRGGVYYEAGFAIGLQKIVIQMCMDSDMGKLHFDTNHNNTIEWNYSAVADYSKRLMNRIRATVELGPGIVKRNIEISD